MVSANAAFALSCYGGTIRGYCPFSYQSANTSPTPDILRTLTTKQGLLRCPIDWEQQAAARSSFVVGRIKFELCSFSLGIVVEGR